MYSRKVLRHRTMRYAPEFGRRFLPHGGITPANHLNFARISAVSKIPLRAWLLALLSACLQILIFPRAPLNFLCWIAVTPLLYALLRGRGGEGALSDSEGRSLRPFTLLQGFMIGWVCGTIWSMGSCYWIVSVMHGYGNVNWMLSVLIMLAFCLILGMHQGAFGLLVVWMGRRSSAGNRRPLLLAPFFL